MIPEQLDLITPLVDLRPASARLTIGQRFAQFHKANPSVYRNLVILTRRAYVAGRRRIGIRQLWEVLRWEYSLATVGDAYKLNDHFTMHYARLIMATVPELKDMFETRKQRAA